MKALSVRQPWAWAIIYALKDIENRGWPIHYRGDILIHAAKTCTKKEYQLTREFCQSMGVVIPELISLRRGQVIGIVTIVDCKFSQVASGWGMPEQYHWKLGNLREITPIPYIGQSQLHHEQLEISIHPDITNYHCHQRQFNIILKISKSRLSRKSR